MGQYHCRCCGAMAVAGLPHPDYAAALEAEAERAEASADFDDGLTDADMQPPQ